MEWNHTVHLSGKVQNPTINEEIMLTFFQDTEDLIFVIFRISADSEEYILL